MVRADKITGEFIDSAPCGKCTRWIKAMKIKNIVYSNVDGELVKIRVKDYQALYQSKHTEILNTAVSI